MRWVRWRRRLRALLALGAPLLLRAPLLLGTPLLLLGALPACCAATAGPPPPLQQLSRAHFDFTLGLYGSLVNSSTGGGAGGASDLLISPYSVFSLLSMVFLGTDSASAASMELRHVLRLDNVSYMGVQRAFRQTVDVMQQPYYRHVFSARTRLLATPAVQVSPLYQRALAEFYSAGVETADLSGADVLETLVSWLSAHAGPPEPDRRLSLLPAPAADRPALLLLARSHFHAQWMYPFDASMTFAKGLFFSKPTQRLEVPMMSRRLRLPLGYSYDLETRVLELPLRRRRVSLFLLLPDDAERGLQRLEANLTADNLRALLSTLKEETVHVKLPRIRLSGSGALRQPLTAQRLRLVFNASAAQLSGVSAEPGLHLNDLVHCASLQLDETGPAVSGDDHQAAGRSPSTSARRRLLRDKYFEVDHPFVFLVWDYFSAMVLLMGRVVNPQPLM